MKTDTPDMIEPEEETTTPPPSEVEASSAQRSLGATGTGKSLFTTSASGAAESWSIATVSGSASSRRFTSTSRLMSRSLGL